MAAVVRSRSSWFARSRETFWEWIVSAASCSLRADRCVCSRYASCVRRIRSTGTANRAKA